MENLILEYVLEVVLIFCSTLYAFTVGKINKKIKEHESIRNSIQALLRDRIMQAYNHYADKGYYPIYARENVNAMYVEYKNLGGNGVLEKLIKELDLLPMMKEN